MRNLKKPTIQMTALALSRGKKGVHAGRVCPKTLTKTAPFLLFCLLILSPYNSIKAQETIFMDPSGRSGDAPRQLLEEGPSPGPPPKFTLPPIPSRPETKPEALPLQKAYVRRIVVTGSTVFSPEQLAEVTRPFENRDLTSQDLETLRQALTLFYIRHGYVTSGAVIPDQSVKEGTIRLHIIEGELKEIDVQGNKWFRAGFLKDRLAPGAKTPVNINPLQYQLQLLQLDPLIQQVNAELKPGVRPGESMLRVQVTEKNPFRAFIGIDNYLSPTVGAERFIAGLAHRNLIGRGDTLQFTYGQSEGLDPQIDIRYSLPINAYGTTIIGQYEKNDSSVIEEPFEPLDIRSESEIYHLTVRHPVYRTLEQEFALALTGEHLHNESFLLGLPFSFSPGTEDGASTVTALRFSQEWIRRTQHQVIAARSRFSLGIDALDATVWDTPLPDGEFISWLGQFQWVRILDPTNVQMVFKSDIQLSNDPLLPLEQMAVGGRYSVRGYRENQLVRDQGFLASMELRIPLLQDRLWADYLQLVPFFDLGASRNRGSPSPPPSTIYSIGLGLRWSVPLMKSPFELRPQLEVYWGHPLRKVQTPEQDDLQDDGIHFQFVITGF
jgi:hemolysin activation/secretion protein